jgi:hypothetical protein
LAAYPDAIAARLTSLKLPSSRAPAEAVGLTAAAALVVVEGAAVSVGDALAQFMPPGWYGEKIVPFVPAFAALRVSDPLP